MCWYRYKGIVFRDDEGPLSRAIGTMALKALAVSLALLGFVYLVLW
jgi:hypothetical protein